MPTPEPQDRAQVIAGLRELANLLEAHPELPVTSYPEILVHAGPVDMGIDDTDEDAKRGAVDQAAAVFGVTPEEHHGHYSAGWLSRGDDAYARYRVSYRVVAITQAATQAYHDQQSYTRNITEGEGK